MRAAAARITVRRAGGGPKASRPAGGGQGRAGRAGGGQGRAGRARGRRRCGGSDGAAESPAPSKLSRVRPGGFFSSLLQEGSNHG